ncbi:hypothetical protein SCWH03_37960 [Streptomyces pacificus]|uniref:Uncharacterized protein n=1 Tax=Streptomyces pacificus TaxID=2705029 RepID=A0A6A0AYH0_9ACTN|nr:hypothetical protein SCWH03_37960 [Streptomyces pacificus]
MTGRGHRGRPAEAADTGEDTGPSGKGSRGHRAEGPAPPGGDTRYRRRTRFREGIDYVPPRGESPSSDVHAFTRFAAARSRSPYRTGIARPSPIPHPAIVN